LPFCVCVFKTSRKEKRGKERELLLVVREQVCVSLREKGGGFSPPVGVKKSRGVCRDAGSGVTAET